MRDCHVENHTKESTRKMFDIKSSEYNSSKKQSKKATNGRKFADEVDSDYKWLLNFLNENVEHTKPPMKEIIRHEPEDDNENDDKDKDPQYCMFLKQLTQNGNSYKLKISKDDETPQFLEYEGPCDPTTDMNVTIGNNGDLMEDMEVERSPKGENLIKNECSKKMNTETQNNTVVDSSYQLFLEGVIHSEYGKFIYEGKQVNYEEKVTNPDSDSDSDSDMLIWDKDQKLSEVDKKQLQPAKKEPSLRRKLIHILKKPYSEKEYEELSKYIEEEKPICRLLPLRGRVVSSAREGLTKSVLDDGPESFRKKLKAVQNERPRALNLMRMFRFWLEHLPNEKIFIPWSHKEFMEVLPSSRKRSHNASR